MSRTPIKISYNYPPKIQERVKSFDEYKDKIPTEKNKVFAKCLASIVIILIISLVLKYVNGYTAFIEGFGYGFLLWTIVNIYDAVVMDIIWFHIKESLIGELIALGVCFVVGLIIEFIL